ncbi:MAG: AI-2E family transporter [Saprospiraceae bacterium]|nr:AI-2E family transporter [Saprospiraceae bacterium]
MTSSIKLPYYAKISIILVGFYVLISMLSIVQDIILPIIYAILLAILVSPLVNLLTKTGVNRTVSILVVLLFSFTLLVTLILWVGSQASLLGEAFPVLSAKFEELLKSVVSWTSDTFNIRASKINRWVTDTKNDLFANTGTAIGMTLSTVGGVLATVFLTPVYIFMLLYYKPHLVQFVHNLFRGNQEDNVTEVLTETKSIVQSYLLGLLAEMAIVAALNSIGLLILGIEYAILLGIGGAILNVIPYLGGLIAIGIFMIIALVTKTPVYALYVFILYAVIQFIDNNLIVPRIVGSKVKLNALVCLIAVIAGGALWGIPGMFLSIPLMAIIKLILDRTPELKPWGFMLGDSIEPLLKLKKKKAA